MLANFDNALFIRLANQGYGAYFLLFLMFVPTIFGVFCGLYLSYVKIRPMNKVGLYCYFSALNMGWVSWFMGFGYVIAIITAILFFFLMKFYLIALRRFMRTIHSMSSE